MQLQSSDEFCRSDASGRNKSENIAIFIFKNSCRKKTHATIPKGIAGSCWWLQAFLKNLKKMARDAMDVCIRVLKESNKVDSTATVSGTECTDHIPYCLSGLSRALFSDKLFRNGNDEKTGNQAREDWC